MTLFLDIETIPATGADALEVARAQTKPPGTLKKPESIAAWWASEGEAAVHEAWLRQALDPAVGELSCFGFATEDGEPRAVVRAEREPERDFLLRAWRTLLAELETDAHWSEARRPFVVAHNAAFDLRFLRMRSWAHRLRLPGWFPGPDARPGRDYGDTMLLAAGHGGRISLEALCRCLGIENPKAHGDGRQAVQLWLSGQHEALAAYCCADVAAVRAAWFVMTGYELEPIV